MDKEKINKVIDMPNITDKDNFYNLLEIGATNEELKEAFDSESLIIKSIRLEEDKRMIIVELVPNYTLKSLVSLINMFHAQGYELEEDNIIGFWFD